MGHRAQVALNASVHFKFKVNINEAKIKPSNQIAEAQEHMDKKSMEIELEKGTIQPQGTGQLV